MSAPERYRQTRDELIALLDLERLLATPVRQLSLGQRMRCEIAASMLHEPRVLFLDEPTIGLDAVAKLAVRDFVKTLNRERGVTVILTTHDMQDVEALAERVIVIGKGVILADSSLSALRRGALAERRLWVALRARTWRRWTCPARRCDSGRATPSSWRSTRASRPRIG